jgi:hypothetical protein
MPDSGAMIGYQTRFAVDIDNTGAYFDLTEVSNVTPPAVSTGVVDVTHMQSPNGDKEFIPALNDPGEAKVTQNFIPGSAADAKVLAVRAARKRVGCQITYPNGVAWRWSGILTGYAPAVPNEDKMTAETSWKVSGSTVAVPAAAPTNAVLPAVSGIAQVGQVLRALPGAWTNAPLFTFQWKKAGANIAGAVNETYTPVVGDLAAAITVAVTGTNTTGAATATSAATVNVIAA